VNDSFHLFLHSVSCQNYISHVNYHLLTTIFLGLSSSIFLQIIFAVRTNGKGWSEAKLTKNKCEKHWIFVCAFQNSIRLDIIGFKNLVLLFDTLTTCHHTNFTIHFTKIYKLLSSKQNILCSFH
jgi:hypothetical protein